MLLPELFIIFLSGLFLGSFFGVLVDRLPRNESVIKGRSYCGHCKKELSPLDLIPVISFLFLRGKCRYCKTKLSFYYPAIELATGALLSLVFYFSPAGGVIQLTYYLFITSVFIIIFFTDLKYGIIPDKVTFPAIIISLVFLLLQRNLLINHLISGILSFLFFVAISYIFFVLTKKESMGGGDIKLAFFLGLFLGFPNIIVCLYIAFLTGAIVAIILVLWRKKSFRQGTIPFGSFMVSGALISLLFGQAIFSQALIFLGL